MTYRRLFLILLAGSTILLTAVWWQSFFWASHAKLSSRTADGQITGHLFYGTVTLGIVENDSNPQTFMAGLQPSSAMDWASGTPLSPWGSFDLGKDHFGTGQVYYLGFPLWAAYLLFTGSAWAALRVMEKRAEGIRSGEILVAGRGLSAGELASE